MIVMISLFAFFIILATAVGIGIYKTRKADKEALKSVMDEPIVIPVDDIFHNMDIQSESPKIKPVVEKPKKTTVKKAPVKKKKAARKTNKQKTKK